MLTSVACSCVRNGRKVSVPVAQSFLFPTVKNSTRTLSLTAARAPPRARLSALLAPPPWLLLSVRSVSLSASSHGGVTDPLGSEAEPTDQEEFGSFSADISSRRSFRKTSPYMQDLQHRDWEEDQEEEQQKPRRRTWRRNTPYWYFLQCKKLIQENKLQEALDLFSKDMLKGERLQPEEFNYSVLIGGCGRAGQLKRAFRLYNDMKKRALTPSDATYTALFNACAESPYKSVGLQQALKLEQELLRKNYALSTITYHALLKVHAVTNNLQACIHTVREMLQKGHAVTEKTFHYLLMGCLTNKETGFRLALQVWRQMLRSGITPDSQNYNLLLRTARDCGIGDIGLATDVLLKLDPERKRASRVKSESRCRELIDIDLLEQQLFLQPGPHSDSDSRVSDEGSTSLVPVRQRETAVLPVDLAADSAAPNLLDFFEGKQGGVVSLCAKDKPSERLALIGGAQGFLEKMAENGLSPDLKTLTLLADTMEPGSLQTLLKVAKPHKVKLDVGFFNCVIRRAARAGDMEEAKSVLSVMRQRNVSVDVRTFGSLALCCKQQEDGLQLLKDMEEAGFRPNVQVFSALIARASHRLDYSYLKTLLKTMRSLEVWPNEVIIKQLEFASQYPPNYNKYKSRNNYLVQIDGFRGYYQEWLTKVPAQSAEDVEAQLQSEAEAAAALKTQAVDGLTDSEKNQRAAARRFKTRNTDKMSGGAAL